MEAWATLIADPLRALGSSALLLATLMAWQLPHGWLWCLPWLGGAVMLALGGWLEGTQLLAAGAALATVWIWRVPLVSPWLRDTAALLAGVLLLALFAGLLDGAQPWVLASGLSAGPASDGWNLVLAPDRLLAGALVLGWRAESYAHDFDRHSLFWGYVLPLAAAMALLVGGGLLAGVLQLEQGLPPWWPWWLVAELLVTVLICEALFRELIQGGLAARWSGNVGGELWPLLLGALAFALLHWLEGGPTMAALALLLGLCYGQAWRYGGLYAALAVHASVQVLHLLLFTYPRSFSL